MNRGERVKMRKNMFHRMASESIQQSRLAALKARILSADVLIEMYTEATSKLKTLEEHV